MTIYRIFSILGAIVGITIWMPIRPVQKSILKEWMEELSKN